MSRARLAILLAVVMVVAAGGWMARGWFEDSKDLAAVQAQRALAAEIQDDVSNISRHVEDRLSQLKANERVIDRGVIREVQKPVYQRVCLGDDAIRLLNAAARGEDRPEPADQGAANPTSAD